MFIEPGNLRDGELLLVFNRFLTSDPEREWVPAYHFNMIRAGSSKVAGNINLRIGNTDQLILYRGHIGYGVKPEYRGYRFAARSVRLLMPLAAAHGLNPLWITCNPDNFASRRTCELAGAELVETINIPADEEMIQFGDVSGIRQKCRYRLVTVE